MSRFSFLIFIAIFLAYFSSVPSFGDEMSSYIESAGEPESYDLDLYGDFTIKDIWTRQLKYKKEADKFSRALRKRQALFAEPRNIVFNRYLENKALMLYGEDNKVELVGDALEDPEDVAAAKEEAKKKREQERTQRVLFKDTIR